jgi:hypothetical protein
VDVYLLIPPSSLNGFIFIVNFEISYWVFTHGLGQTSKLGSIRRSLESSAMFQAHPACWASEQYLVSDLLSVDVK